MARRNPYWLILASFVYGLPASTFAQELGPGNSIIDLPPQRPSQATEAVTPPFTTLYRFPGASGVYFPRGGLAMDSGGNLYGTTLYGGKSAYSGVVYELKAPAWSYKELHSGILYKQGTAPTAPLTIVGDVIYGTMSAGGHPACGCGVVFKMSTDGSGYQEFHVFGPNLPAKQVNGATPIGGLLIDGDTMYGTTEAGGDHGSGVLYKLSTDGSGFQVLHQFAGYQGQQTSGPQGELLLGQDGFIYGTQYGGGKYDQGTVFRISKTGSGFEVLYTFLGTIQPGNSTDGANPEGRLAQGADGTIYGTTTFGGTPSGYGTAWSLKLTDGKWVYKQLRRFAAGSHFNDANLPHAGLVIDANGVLYGAGAGGGVYQSGAVYELTPPAKVDDEWAYKTLYSFKGQNTNGNSPYGPLMLNDNLLYGANVAGGDFTQACNAVVDDGCGTVFRINP
jgi:uncharacterized repeat protein (TIGR03803 family)